MKVLESPEAVATRRAVLGTMAGAGLCFAGGRSADAAAGFGHGPRSGMPWNSGCQLSRIAEFEAFRGRRADTYTIWSRRRNWSEITDVGGGGFATVRGLGGRISYGLAMLPESNHAGRDPRHWVPAAAGNYDRYYDSVARQVAASGATNVIFRIGWESNDRSSPWYAGGDPARFKATFQRIAAILRSRNPTCLIEWCNVKDGAQPGSILNLYPGDAYVDIIGVNFFDGYPAMTSDAVWASAYRATLRGGPRGIGAWLDFTRSRRKRFAVSEWGVWRGRPGCGDNAFYIRKMYDFFRACGADLAYENYFNQIAKHQISPASVNPVASREYRRLWS